MSVCGLTLENFSEQRGLEKALSAGLVESLRFEYQVQVLSLFSIMLGFAAVFCSALPTHLQFAEVAYYLFR